MIQWWDESAWFSTTARRQGHAPVRPKDEARGNQLRAALGRRPAQPSRTSRPGGHWLGGRSAADARDAEVLATALVRPDVLVQAEEVRRIVLTLQGLELRVAIPAV